MSCDLRIGVILPHCCRVFDDLRPKQSLGFSDAVALSATTPDPITNSRCLLPQKLVLWSHYMTPNGGLRYVSDSNSKWREKATEGLRYVFDVWNRTPIFRFSFFFIRPVCACIR
uniref:Uncharacterized protein n=1 Tax=Schistocephalus solidus TaxID=70667 RepID=A0A0V0J275_SCHSO